MFRYAVSRTPPTPPHFRVPQRVKCILSRGDSQSSRRLIPSPLISKSKLANFSPATRFVRFLSPILRSSKEYSACFRAWISNFRGQTSILSTLPISYGKNIESRSFFFFNDEKLELPFVNGNIEKSYKFGAVYPQNFTFFQYRFVLGMTHAIRKIRIYGKNHTGNWASERGRHRRNE